MGTIAESWADKLNATDNTRAYNRVNSRMQDSASRTADVTERSIGECRCEESHICDVYYFADGSLYADFKRSEIYDGDHDDLFFENESDLIEWLNENEDIVTSVWIDGRLV